MIRVGLRPIAGPWVRCAAAPLRPRPPLRRQPRRPLSESAPPGPELVTLPIFYANGSPHVGHLFSALLGDASVRSRRLAGRQAVLTCGTDEHGIKVSEAAAAEGVEPAVLCARVSREFRDALESFDVRFDDWIRTTEARHQRAVSHLWTRLAERGHIYLGEHRGWYCRADEAFVPENQLEPAPGAPPGLEGEQRQLVTRDGGRPVEWLSEQNYKFRLSAFQEPLLWWLESPEGAAGGVLEPAGRRKEVVASVRAGLADLSVSRLSSKVPWSIPVPGDPSHGVYVWLDALTNYLTLCGYPDRTTASWPAALHVVGKDIVRFHCVYWPAFLMAAGMEPPRAVLAHAHWLKDHRKMSKSLGNVVSLPDLRARFGSEAVRFYLLREGRLDEDSNLSEDDLRLVVNRDLADSLGNLLMRCLAKAFVDPNEPRLPRPLPHERMSEGDKSLVAILEALPGLVEERFAVLDFRAGLEHVFAAVAAGNAYFTSNEPWSLRKSSDLGSRERLDTVLCLTLELLRVVGLYLQPCVPQTASAMLDRLGVPESERLFSFARLLVRPPLSPLGTAFADGRKVLFGKLER